ncbi:MAG: PD-(D/E)XK nuclease domain-containing protein, partial [Muribaculaceae bacterium]|nr:PD-(D/E)XK nuclease domain-containing protein [Muribaculaceae bacterium]
DYGGEFSVRHFQLDLRSGNIEEFMERLQTLLKNVPYEQHNEKFYQNLVYLLFILLGADARMEEHTNRGRTDLVVRIENYVYVFEFKYNGSSEKALRQIMEKDYAGRFRMEDREIYLIGANFSTKERGLEGWRIEKLGD